MKSDIETFIDNNRHMTERAVLLANVQIKNHLDNLIEKATAALVRLNDTGTANYVDSNINGIGSVYDEMIRTIERKNSFQQMLDYVFTESK
jgi:hypothetical protein